MMLFIFSSVLKSIACAGPTWHIQLLLDEVVQNPRQLTAVDFRFPTDPYKRLAATNKPAPAIRRFKDFSVLLSVIGCVVAIVAFIFKPGLTILFGFVSAERPKIVTISNAPSS